MKIIGIIALICLNMIAFWIVGPIEIIIGIPLLIIYIISKQTKKNEERKP